MHASANASTSVTTTATKATAINYTIITTVATIKTKGIKGKHLGCMKLILNTPCLRGRVRNFSGTVDRIKLKLSAYFKRHIEESKSIMRILLLLLLQLLLLRKLRILR